MPDLKTASGTSKVDEDPKGSQQKYTHDGALIEGTANNGQVLIVQKTPEFMRDIAPYFAPSFIIIFAHFIYAYTGNLLLPIWLMYLVTPIGNFIAPEDNQNLTQKCERAYLNDKRFWAPLYAFNILETITWLWALIVMSDQVNIDCYWFQLKPETNGQYFLFCLQWGYFCGLNAIGGHELMHKRETVNKLAGTWAYTKFMYSHFLDEHLQGHHKAVSTYEDPATSRRNESLYAFIPRSVIGGHINTWNREVKRIKKEFGDDVATTIMLFNNKMVTYFIIHASICGSIFFFLGW
mgnify:FL=1|jgi:hypothetical protein